MATKKPIDPKTLRRKLALNQTQFWSPLGVTQSGGSRYESGRALPKPVRMLLSLAYGGGSLEQLQSGKLAKCA